jgi:hypothetical protein
LKIKHHANACKRHNARECVRLTTGLVLNQQRQRFFADATHPHGSTSSSAAACEHEPLRVVQAHVTLKIVLLACSQGLISRQTIEHDDWIGAEGDLEFVGQCGHGHWVDFE